MVNVAGIHQPNYIPWLGYFYKIFCSDIFVLLNDVQFSKGTVGNRNKIKTLQGTELLLTAPIVHKNGDFLNYNKVEIDYKANWQKKHLSSIRQNYSKSPNFKQIFDGFESIVNTRFPNLAELNIALILYFIKLLGINTKIVCSSEIQKDLGTQTERLINICKYFGANTYLSGKGGSNYQDENLFASNGIKLEYTNYKPFEYRQLTEPFIPNLSILDVLFNCKTDDVLAYFNSLKKA